MDASVSVNNTRVLQYRTLDITVDTDGIGYSVKLIDPDKGHSSTYPTMEQVSKELLDAAGIEVQRNLMRYAGRRTFHLLIEEHAPVNEVKTLGRQLFEVLFGDNTLYYWLNSFVEECKRSNQGIRFRIRTQSPAVNRLPFEYMYADEGLLERYFALKRDVSIVRSHPNVATAAQLNLTIDDMPLRILGVIANPYGDLSVAIEKQLVIDSLQELTQTGLAQIDWIEGATERELRRAVERAPHILHFIGHGEFDSKTDEGYIILEKDRTGASRLSATQLANFLEMDRDLRLVVLNTCESAYSGDISPYSSVASQLHRSGVPAVLAMQNVIADKTASLLVGELYLALAEGRTIDQAVADVRTHIHLANDDSLEWGTVALFLHGDDGRLLSATEEELAHYKQNYIKSQKEREEQKQAQAKQREQDIVDTAISEAKTVWEKQARLDEEKLRSSLSARHQSEMQNQVAHEVAAAEQKFAVQLADEQAKWENEHDSALLNQKQRFEIELKESKKHAVRAGKHQMIRTMLDFVPMMPESVRSVFTNPLTASRTQKSLRPSDAHNYHGEAMEPSAQPVVYYVSRIPVTNLIYGLYCRLTGAPAPLFWTSKTPPNGKEMHPVTGVDWQAAMRFCIWLGGRLPTVKEWYGAATGYCYGVNVYTYPWGNDLPSPDRCNFGNHVGSTTPVRRYPPSLQGLYDVAGNVWEWTSSPASALVAPAASAQQAANQPDDTDSMLICGGSYESGIQWMECAKFTPAPATMALPTIGFRVLISDRQTLDARDNEEEHHDEATLAVDIS